MDIASNRLPATDHRGAGYSRRRPLRRAPLTCTLALTAICGFPAQAADWIYTVRPGDNLWNLTEQHTTSLRYVDELVRLNNVAEPKRLQPGTRLRFPLAWLKIQPAGVEVIAVAGESTVLRRGSDQAVELTRGLRLFIGDTLTTGGDGNVLLRFADGSTMALRSDSEIVMDTLSVYGDTGMADSRLRLQRGRSNIKAKPETGPGSRFEIRTPAAVSAVRGTEFRIAAEAERAVARTEVTEGRVAVSKDELVHSVPQNFGLVARAEEPLSKPVELLPAPDGRALPKLVQRVPVKLRWTALTGAAAYRAQVSSNESYSTLLVDRRVDQPSITFDLAEDGLYFLRLRGIDKDGLEGLDRLGSFELDARPLPPFSVKPVDAAKVRNAQPVFEWSLPVKASEIVFQLARDSDFTERIVDETLPRGGSYQPGEPLVPGEYYWRLASVTAEEVGPYGDVLSFRYQPPPSPPDSEPPQMSDGGAVFRWQAGEPGERYRFQVARDPDFDRLLVDEIVAEANYALDVSRSGTYYVRIATVDADDVQGAFGEAQSFEVPRSPHWWVAPLTWLVMILAL